MKLPVVICFDPGLKWNTMRAVCTVRDGGSVERELSFSKAVDDSGKKCITLNDIDNGSPGTYKIEIYGAGEYTGKVTLNYKVE